MPQSLVKFAIVAAPRSGSNMLCTLLNGHPQVLCHHELFNPTGIFYALDLRESSFSVGTMADRDADPVAFLRRVWQQPLGRSRVGFKTTWRQNPAVYESILSDPEINIILLRRANKVKSYVSFLVATQTGAWEAYHGQTPGTARVSVSVDVMLEHIRFNDAYYRETEERLACAGKSPLRLTYEDLLSDEEHHKLFGFLGIRGMEWSGSAICSVKQTPADLTGVILNFDEVARALEGSELREQMTSIAP